MFDKPVFLIIPNNSGSTFTSKSIARCENVTRLPGEGQFIDGFCGTRPVDYNCSFIWAGTDFRHIISDEAKHDWEATKHAWSKVAKNHKDGNIFLEKSPPNIAKVDMLNNSFPNAKFIISMRNPYAVMESIKRVKIKKQIPRLTIIRHIVETMRIQKQNIESLDSSKFIHYRYEDLCDNTNQVEKQIKDFIPELHDLTFQNKIKVKKRYHSSVTNYNDEQISRLSQKEIQQMSHYLKYNTDLVEFFNYEIL